MKLRNKKTGEIIELNKGSITDVGLGSSIRLQATDRHNKPIWIYNSLAELNEEWEDYKEPKTHWNITQFGDVTYGVDEYSAETVDEMKQIGNYFNTKEEAEKAVEKLKAWRRLKDKGFRFEGWDNTDRSTIHNFSLFVAIEDLESINKDLDLLFGGEK